MSSVETEKKGVGFPTVTLKPSLCRGGQAERTFADMYRFLSVSRFDTLALFVIVALMVFKPGA